MAEEKSTGTGSRRKTTQPATGPTQNTRATRSQSHEISESDVPTHGHRTRRKPKQAASPSVNQSNNGVNATSRGKGTPEQTDLPAVDEDPSILNDDDIGRDEAMETAQEYLPASDLKSTGRVSGISGTTARTSNTTQELAGLVSEDLNVLDALPDLAESSIKFLTGLLPADMSRNSISGMRSGLQDKHSGSYRSRKRFIVDLESCYPDHSSNTFMDISKALPLLYEIRDDQNTDSDRIVPVFHAANLAILAPNLLLYPREEDELFLKNLDANFPDAFAADGYDQALGIDTRTQYAIEQLDKYKDQPNFDHDVVLNQVFYNEDGRTLRGYNVLTGRDRGYKDALTKTLQVIKRVRDIWTEESQSPPIERLRDIYIWDEYVADMITWINGKNEEVKTILDKVPTEDVVLGLKETLNRIKSAKEASSRERDHTAEPDDGQVDLTSYSPPMKLPGATIQQDERPKQSSTRARDLAGSQSLGMGSPRLGQGAKSMKRAMNKHLKGSGSTQEAFRNPLRPAQARSQAVSVAVPAMQNSTAESDKAHLISFSAPAKIQKDQEPFAGGHDDNWTQHADDDDLGLQDEDEEEEEEEEEEEAFQTQQTHQNNAERAMRLKDSREAESNKENQAESSQRPTKRRLLDRQANAQKETWASQDISEDEGFQQPRHRPSLDRQILGSINKRTAPEPSTNSGRSPAKRARFQNTSISIEDDNDDDTNNNDNNNNTARPQQTPQATQVYNLANQAAKRMTALQPKVPQTRRAWTEAETERLLELIEMFGTSWKQLKAEDEDGSNVLAERDQVALKDKARNMKFDFLKAGRMLPRNFDKVALSKGFIDKLGGLGIVYDTVTGMREDAEE